MTKATSVKGKKVKNVIKKKWKKTDIDYFKQFFYSK